MMIAGTQLAHDEALPKLSAALDSARMKEEFDRHLFSASGHVHGCNTRFRVADCRIERVKYKRGQKCLVCYELDISDQERGGTSRQLVSTRMYPPGSSDSRFRKALQQNLGQPPAGAPLAHLSHLDMVAWAFPNERKLAGLPLLADREILLQEHLPYLVRQRFGSAWTISEADHSIAHYVPERSCTIRIVMKLSQEKTAQRFWTVFGKTYYNDDGKDVFRVMRRLRRDFAAQAEVLELPRALAYDTASRTLWQEGLCGESLLARYPNDRIAVADAELLAHAIAEFHATSIDRLPVRTVAGLLDDALEKLSVVVQAWPACAGQMSEVADRLAASVPRDSDHGTVHTDLHPNNVFLSGGKIALIDLDGLHRGPVLSDLGSFSAGVLYRACLHRRPPAGSLAELAVFASNYQRYSGIQIEPAALNWFTAAALVAERCSRAVSRLKPGRLQIIDDLAGLAANLLRDEATILQRRDPAPARTGS